VSIRRQRPCTPSFSTDPSVRVPSSLIRPHLITTSSSFLCRASDSSAQQPLDLTEENVERVLLDARSEVRALLIDGFLFLLPFFNLISRLSLSICFGNAVWSTGWSCEHATMSRFMSKKHHHRHWTISIL
jgi:hypothetical protein